MMHLEPHRLRLARRFAPAPVGDDQDEFDHCSPRAEQCGSAFAGVEVPQHRGRIVKTSGDGLMVEFASVVDGVRCAVEIQRAMAGRNRDVPTKKRIEFRVGIKRTPSWFTKSSPRRHSASISANSRAGGKSAGTAGRRVLPQLPALPVPWWFPDTRKIGWSGPCSSRRESLFGADGFPVR
jgi:hypothetical protein